MIEEAAPDMAAVKAARRLQSASQFGDRVLELCAMADIVFMALHGQCGEDGRVQAVFDMLGIKYTGSGHLGSAIAMDKDLTKRIVAPLGVLTPEWRTYELAQLDLDAACGEVRAAGGGEAGGFRLQHRRLPSRIRARSCAQRSRLRCGRAPGRGGTVHKPGARCR